MRADFTLPGAQPHYPPDQQMEPRHIDIDLHVDVDNRQASGTVTTTVVANADGADSLELHAVDFDDVKVRCTDGHEIHSSYDGRLIRVHWHKPLPRGHECRIAVSYRVTRPATGLFFSTPDKAYPAAPRWAATDHETERARHWLPCVDLPHVRTTLDFALRCDKDFTVVANGALVEESANGDGTKTSRWKLEQRCPSYLVCFALGDFVRCDDGDHHGKPIAYFTSREHSAADLKRSFGGTGAMLDWMTKKLGSELPWPKYFQFALQHIGGAMENISLVSWDDMFVLGQDIHKEWGWLVDKINLHEMAHTWFGDLIVCRDFAQAWLKESWAVYMETCWHEDTQGPDERDYDFYSNLEQYLAEADGAYMRPIMTRVFDHSWNMYDRHLYPGGAVRLHMLRHEIGSDLFWAGVRDYVARYSGKVVETEDFRRVMEEHSGRSLVKWFEQWICSKGYPNLKVSFSFDPGKQLGTFEVEQAQSDKDIPVFEFTTDLGWVIDGKAHSRQVRITGRKHAFNLAMPKDPSQVRFDPHNRTVCKLDFNPGDDKMRRQLTDAPDVVGRIRAAVNLCKGGRRSGIEAVGEAFRREKFWGVRVRMAEALSDSNTQAALEVLCGLVAHEKDGRVCEAVVRACGRFRDEAARAALQTFLKSGPKLPRARAAALDCLGTQRDKAPLDLLVSAARKEDHGGWEQSAAFRALGATRMTEAFKPLADALPWGKTSTRTRGSAAAALGSLARWLDKPQRADAIEKLSDLLRDPQQRMQKAAMAGLQGALAVEALDDIEQWGNSLSDQEQSAVRKAMFGIRAAAKPKEPAKDRDIDELRQKLRKLEDRLEKLDPSAKATAHKPAAGKPAKKAAKKAGKKTGKKPRRK
ncbi:MAG: M1 family metallopeptidase [Planctomycetes bacterium]|nr:M1 family metallopeptidase [Planctomycetota bacterium]